MFSTVLSKLVITNIKTGKPSYTLTAFIVGVFIVNLKLIMSGMDLKGFKFSDFSGMDYAASMAALGGIYSLNKAISKKDNSSNTNA